MNTQKKIKIEDEDDDVTFLQNDFRDKEDSDFERCMLPLLNHNNKGKVKSSKYGFNIATNNAKIYRICSEVHFGHFQNWERIKSNCIKTIKLITFGKNSCDQCKSTKDIAIKIMVGKTDKTLHNLSFCAWDCTWTFFSAYKNPNQWKTYVNAKIIGK